MTQKRIHQFRARLLDWYRQNKRDLPWRKTKDPYQILVSEIMLQQTQAETVVPYYQRFLDRFPDLKSLAGSATEDVMRFWQGLGYYRRARYLREAARTILHVHDGAVPSTAKELQNLPGVGAYTAAAVASIAFHEPVAVVDGNVIRVVARLFQLDAPLGTARLKREVHRLANSLLPEHEPGEFNQAMMELGATVCTPKSPACPKCPIRFFCQSSSTGQSEAFPVASPRKRIPTHRVAVALIVQSGKLLLSKRFDNAMLGGLWELPGGKVEPGETPEECVQRELEEELGIRATVKGHLATVRHTYSHFRVQLECFRCEITAGQPRAIACADVAWTAPEELADRPMPSGTVKILKSVGFEAFLRRMPGQQKTERLGQFC